jgi:hypothetical protein
VDTNRGADSSDEFAAIPTIRYARVGIKDWMLRFFNSPCVVTYSQNGRTTFFIIPFDRLFLNFAWIGSHCTDGYDQAYN